MCENFNGRCYYHCGRWYSQLINEAKWLMFLPLVADRIATIVTCNIYARYYCQGGIDVIATRVVFLVYWQMELANISITPI